MANNGDVYVDTVMLCSHPNCDKTATQVGSYADGETYKIFRCERGHEEIVGWTEGVAVLGED